MAAQQAGQYGAALPEDLARALQCRAWGALPRAGGLEDQPYGFIERATMLLNVYDAFRGLRHVEAGGLVAWSQRAPGAWEVICWVWDNVTGGMT